MREGGDEVRYLAVKVAVDPSPDNYDKDEQAQNDRQSSNDCVE